MQISSPEVKTAPSVKDRLMFFIPSCFGIMFFMVPFQVNGSFTIPIAFFSQSAKSFLGDQATIVVTFLVVFSAFMSLIARFFQPKFIQESKFLSTLFLPTLPWLVVRALGAIFIAMCYLNAGPAAVINSNTGQFVLGDLLPTLLSVFIFAGFCLPLLTNFGLLEFIGTLMTRIMRPLFGLPGRSAVDCASSWLGDGSVAILMSSKQYEQGHYTEREAAIVGTTFSIVSISFSLVVIAQVGLEQMFMPFYLTVCLSGLVAAIIVPRLPPLSWKKDRLISGEIKTEEADALPEGQSLIHHGYQLAVHRASQIPSLQSVFKEGIENAVDMVLGVLPVVMAIGTSALMLAEYTPVFQWLGMPFVPLLEWLHIPHAAAASETILVGIADMFIPAVLAADIPSEMTRFVIACLSVTQLIYMSEVGALLLGSKIPVKLWELVIIFVLRTLVTLPVIAGIAHLIF